MTHIYISSFEKLANGDLGNIPLVLMPGARSQKYIVPTDASTISEVLKNNENILRIISEVSCAIYFKGWAKDKTDSDPGGVYSVVTYLAANAAEYFTVPQRIEHIDGSMPWYNRGIFIRKEF